jgi:hypothetical protein
VIIRRALYIAVLGAALVFSTGTAFARTTASSPSWISLQQPATPAVTGWEPSLGQLVMFASASPNNVKNPRIEVLCYQSGKLVYGEAGSASQATQQQLTGSPGFVLGGSASVWLSSGGAAECTANLFYFGSKAGVQTYNLLATTTFSASA